MPRRLASRWVSPQVETVSNRDGIETGAVEIIRTRGLLAADASVHLTIFNAVGRPVRHWALEHQSAGSYLTRDNAVYWDGRDASGELVGSGLYFYLVAIGQIHGCQTDGRPEIAHGEIWPR